MDLRRTARIETWYFGDGDDTSGVVEWFVAPADAKFFKGPTPFRSLDWWDGLGQIPRGPGPAARVLGTYTLGKTIPGYTGKKPCGKEDWFTNGIPSPPPPNPIRNFFGVPDCCLEGSVGKAASQAVCYKPSVTPAFIDCLGSTIQQPPSNSVTAFQNCVTAAGSLLVVQISSIAGASSPTPPTVIPPHAQWRLAGFVDFGSTLRTWLFYWPDAPPVAFETFYISDGTALQGAQWVEVKNAEGWADIDFATASGTGTTFSGSFVSPIKIPESIGLVFLASRGGVGDMFHPPAPWTYVIDSAFVQHVIYTRTMNEVSNYSFSKAIAVPPADWAMFLLAWPSKRLSTIGIGFAASLALTDGRGKSLFPADGATSSTSSVAGVGAGIFPADGATSSTSSVAGVGSAAIPGAGSAGSTATVTAVGSSSGSVTLDNPATTTWTAVCGPSGLVHVAVYGAGGGGGHGAVVNGGGGGGGAYGELTGHAITAGTVYNVQIGTGGGQNTDGTATWFDSTSVCLADFGRGGVGAAAGAAGNSANNVPSGVGNSGGAGSAISGTTGGGGGSSGTAGHIGNAGTVPTGGAAPDPSGGAGGNGGTAGNPGNNGVQPGGGAGGSGRLGPTGGTGGNGRIVISWSS